MEQELPLTKKAIDDLKLELKENKEEAIKKIDAMIKKIKEAL
ncbi:MAG: hypothetical protein R3Y43_02065 [Alphaproteobacteria bacterium]